LRVEQTIRVGPYRNSLGALTRLGTLLRTFKYHGRAELGETLGSWLGEAVDAASWRDRIEAVVTVPTHWKHRLVRPLYAAELLASVVARSAGLPETRMLRRVRAGPHQIGLSYTARHANVRGAFAVRRGVKLHQARLLLVDDVKTTGATIEECARILRAAGAAEVYAAVAVKVPWTAPTGQAIRSI
jgi:ComF family protein